MKFSDHLLIERTYDDVIFELLEEGLGDVTETIRKYVTDIKNLKTKAKSAGGKLTKEMFNSELLKYKHYLESFPGLQKFTGPLVKELNEKIKNNEQFEPSILKYVSMAALNLLIECIVGGNFYLIKTLATPKVFTAFAGISMESLTGISNVLFSMVDAQTFTELISAAINVVKSIPSAVKKTKLSVEKLVKSIKGAE